MTWRTSSDLAWVVRSRLGVPISEAADAVDLVFELIKKHLAAGEKVKISGFGVFHVKYKKGGSVHLKRLIRVLPHHAVTFKYSRLVRKLLNDGKYKDLPSTSFAGKPRLRRKKPSPRPHRLTSQETWLRFMKMIEEGSDA